MLFSNIKSVCRSLKSLKRWRQQNRLVLRVGVLFLAVAIIVILRQIDTMRGHQNLVKGPISLSPELQLTISYPRRLEVGDRGTGADKKIVISAIQITTQVPTKTIHIYLSPVSKTVNVLQLLTREGAESDGHLSIQLTPDRFSHGALYIEYTGVTPTPLSLWHVHVPFDIRIVPQEPRTCTFHLPNLFSIKVEGPIESVIRDVWSTIIGLMIGGWVVLDPIKEWWKSRQKALQSLTLEMMEQLREGNLDKALESYNRCQDVLSLTFYPSAQIEELHAQAEGGRCYAEAMKALRSGDRRAATIWLEQARTLIKLSRDADDLEKSLQNLESKSPELRARMLEKVDNALEERKDISKQIVASIGLVKLLETERAEPFRQASKETVREWFLTFPLFPVPFDHNPFEMAKGERDTYLELHFFEHPAYKALCESSTEQVALFADTGGGKSSCRLMLANLLRRDEESLVVEYTDFAALVTNLKQISAKTHVEMIVQEGMKQLKVASGITTAPDASPQECLQWLLSLAKEKGYKTLYILVDSVDTCAEVQAHPKLIERLMQHLVSNFDLLNIPGVYFKFFLPNSIKDRLLKYEGFTTPQIRIVDVKWDTNLLFDLLGRRLNPMQAKPEKRLMELVSSPNWPKAFDLDKALVAKAKDSPRRLITLVNMLFQHRAQIWHESGESPDELYITMADWATLLEYLLRQGDVI